MQAWLQAHQAALHWYCPQLPASPAQAMRAVFAGIQAWPKARMAVVGSSLGGFYASVVAEATGCPAVVLNPAVHPERDLLRHIGEHTAWHGQQERLRFEAAHIEELAAMKPVQLTHPERYAAVIAQGDELLDWREMAARHAGAQLRIVAGGDHALSGFDTQHLPFVLRFLKLWKEPHA